MDASLKPSEVELSNEYATIFKEMGVVQGKAISKGKKLLFSTNLSLDFSDGPYSMYGINTNIGYALSDFWEIYANLVPMFINNKRSIVEKVEELRLEDGERATITAPLAKMQYGIELLWAPLYGKDSLGLRNIVRSDTFLKIGAARIMYSDDSGYRFHAGLGKTYFLSQRLGLRITAAANYLQTVVDKTKSFRWAATLESGVVFYLL